MLFTSFSFVIFFPLVFILYWFIFDRKLRLQNLVLLAASYIFYGWWSWKFLILLFLTGAVNYASALFIQGSVGQSRRKAVFLLTLLFNIGILFVFKYFNFFSLRFASVLSLLGLNIEPWILNVALPVGISFYIFLAISYLVDVYKFGMDASRDPVELLLSLSFFPILLAGPIHRPVWLLQQIRSPREFDNQQARDGLRQILWGLVMKIVIADNIASEIGRIFENPADQSGSTLVLGIFFFSIQIYADFAGYSNMAIGLGKLLGFRIMQNFNYPYFSRDIKEFWTRWNISLTSWFRDYVYLPFAFSVSRKLPDEKVIGIRTDFIIYGMGLAVTWFLTGLWHGAGMNFIAWGAIQGLFLFLHQVAMKPRKRLLHRMKLRNDSPVLRIPEAMITMMIVMISWVFFRSSGVYSALTYFESLGSNPFWSKLALNLPLLIGVFIFLAIEWIGRTREFPIQGLDTIAARPLRWLFYIALLFIVFFCLKKDVPFIYFQF